MPRKNNENNEQEQQLVLYGADNNNAGQEPEAAPQERENGVPGTGELDSYFKKFRYFEENISNYDSIMNYTVMVTRLLSRGVKDEEAAKLREDFKNFSSRVKEISMDIAKEVNTAVNESGDRKAAAGVDANAERLTAIRKEFNNLSNRLESFMRSKPANPAVSAILDRTKNIVGDGAPVVGRVENKATDRAFTAGDGPNKKERQAFFAIYTRYLQEMVNVSLDEFMVAKNDDTSPTDRLKGNLNHIFEVNQGYEPESIFYVNLEGFPIPKEKEDLKKLSTEEGQNSYLKQIDDYFIKNPESLDEGKLKRLTQYVENHEEMFKDIDAQVEFLRDIMKVIEDDKITWDVKKQYLRNICGAGRKEGLPEKYNVEYELDDYVKDSKKGFDRRLKRGKGAKNEKKEERLKTPEEQIKGAKKWLGEVRDYIVQNNRYKDSREKNRIMVHAMYKMGADFKDNRSEFLKVLEAGKKILDNETSIPNNMKGVLDHLIRLRDVMEKKLEPGELRTDPTIILRSMEKAADTYFRIMEEQDPRMCWKKDQIENFGAVIDVLSAINPANKAKLCARLDLKANEKGQYFLGGDLPLVTRSAEKMSVAKKEVLDADPRLMKSSPEYKAMRAATEKLQKKADDFLKARKTEGKLSNEQIMELLSMAEEADRCAEQYTAYKLADVEAKGPNKIELKRLNAAASVSGAADDIKRYIREYTLEKVLPEGPKAALNAVEKQVYRREVPTPEDLASMVYLHKVREEFDKNPNEFSAEKALKYNTMKKNVSKMLTDKNFQEIVEKMPKDLKGVDAKNHVYNEMKKAAQKKVKKTGVNNGTAEKKNTVTFPVK